MLTLPLTVKIETNRNDIIPKQSLTWELMLTLPLTVKIATNRNDITSKTTSNLGNDADPSIDSQN